MKISLIVARGQAAGLEVPIAAPDFRIGRSARCDLRPASFEVSRQHCEITQRAGQVFVRDLDSTNGTYINGIRAVGEVPVIDGDTLQVGLLVFTFKIEEAEPGSPAATRLPVEDSAELLINELEHDDREHSEQPIGTDKPGKSGFHYWETQFKRDDAEE